MATPKEECEALMDELIPFAIQMIEQHGEFFPFGANLLSNGETELCGGYEGEDSTAQEIIDLMRSANRQAGAKGEIIASGLAIDMRIRSDGGRGKPVDAIGMELDHRDGYSVIVFAPYTIGRDGVELGDFSAQKGTASIFPM